MVVVWLMINKRKKTGALVLLVPSKDCRTPLKEDRVGGGEVRLLEFDGDAFAAVCCSNILKSC